jgi:hypothetical protein
MSAGHSFTAAQRGVILRLAKKDSLPMSTNRPTASATGAALVSLSARVLVPLTVAVERDPFVGADVRARFVVPVRIQLAQPIEFPVGVGEVLDGALVAWAGRIRLLSVQGRR